MDGRVNWLKSTTRLPAFLIHRASPKNIDVTEGSVIQALGKHFLRKSSQPMSKVVALVKKGHHLKVMELCSEKNRIMVENAVTGDIGWTDALARKYSVVRSVEAMKHDASASSRSSCDLDLDWLESRKAIDTAIDLDVLGTKPMHNMMQATHAGSVRDTISSQSSSSATVLKVGAVAELEEDCQVRHDTSSFSTAIFDLPRGTLVKIMNFAHGRIKIHVARGRHIGRCGWINALTSSGNDAIRSIDDHIEVCDYSPRSCIARMKPGTTLLVVRKIPLERDSKAGSEKLRDLDSSEMVQMKKRVGTRAEVLTFIDDMDGWISVMTPEGVINAEKVASSPTAAVYNKYLRPQQQAAVDYLSRSPCGKSMLYDRY